MSTNIIMTDEELIAPLKDDHSDKPFVRNLMTDEELMQLPNNGYKYEYVNGELRMSPAGMLQETTGSRLIQLIGNYLDENPVAELCGSSTGYRMSSGNLRSPDVSVVRLERLPGGEVPKGFGYFAPDLAVEVLSPNQTPAKLREKIEEYFSNGTELVWLVNEEQKTVIVYRSPDDYQTLGESDTLDGSPVLPGFSCRVSEIFKKRRKKR